MTVVVLEVVGQHFSEVAEVEQPAVAVEAGRKAIAAEVDRKILVVVRTGIAVVAAACTDLALLASVVVARLATQKEWNLQQERSGSRAQRSR